MKNTTRKSSDKKQGHQQFTRRACGNTNRVVSRRGSKSEPEIYHVSAYNTSNLKKQELVYIPSACQNLTIEDKNLGDRWCLTCGGYFDYLFLPGVNVVVTSCHWSWLRGRATFFRVVVDDIMMSVLSESVLTSEPL